MVSSKICSALVPSIDPAAPTASKSSGTSRCSSVKIGVDDPPGVQNFSRCPARTPPASESSSRSVTPSGASYWPGVVTWPDSEKMPKPLDFSVPSAANAPAPRAMMEGTLAIDSTLLTTVGQAYRPSIAGNGGFSLGWPR